MIEDLEALGPVGNLVKAVRVDAENATIHYRLPGGGTGRATGLANLQHVAPGDVLILGSAGWESTPPGLWKETNSVAVVREVLEDNTVVVELNHELKVLSNDFDIEVEKGNTIEYNAFDGVIRVIADTPIRSSLLSQELDVDDVKEAYLWDASSLGAGFSDFGGYPRVKERARELIETQLERREKLEKIRARPVKGVLFTGPPGTGKTHLARIIARESKAEFFLVSGPSIVSKYVGSSEDTLRKIFEAATKCESGRAIIFFDEIDSIAEHRGGDSHESSRKLVAQFLTLMDGFDDQGKSVMVIAATNRVEALDPALTRPGRFDWEIEFGLPTMQDRFEILSVRANQLETIGELPLEDIALLTEGWSAAELTAIWTEAALVAAGDDREAISPEDVSVAYERVSQRPKRTEAKEVSK
ncbi:AAA family ATPase [Leucobacter sp. UT-8R-CII-1-4]|uniref:AAA family ATPase n=1 Tax=Leucobacter sp. UT-8R-CII-1-4 TaxID=3040075 RepID=UPI0024A84B8D|nr:AAA family ATPase [Leucobacter sp. UT-8R-CII-1-4]MDI6023582.1 AAA family ATPase [Leucobacter sp. UT-8R-CII-1-4]